MPEGGVGGIALCNVDRRHANVGDIGIAATKPQLL